MSRRKFTQTLRVCTSIMIKSLKRPTLKDDSACHVVYSIVYSYVCRVMVCLCIAKMRQVGEAYARKWESSVHYVCLDTECRTTNKTNCATFHHRPHQSHFSTSQSKWKVSLARSICVVKPKVIFVVYMQLMHREGFRDAEDHGTVNTGYGTSAR